MNRDRLYEKAFAFRKTKMWEYMNDDQLFAIRVKDTICYLNVMGMLGEHVALGVYPGEEGLRSLYRIYLTGGESEKEQEAAALGQITVQCVLGDRDEVTPEERKSVQAYSKQHGISLRGRYTFPYFMRIYHFQPMTEITTDEEADMLEQALDAAIWVNEQMKMRKITINPLWARRKTLPLVVRDEAGFHAEDYPLLPMGELTYPEGHTENEAYKERTRKMPKEGQWACKIILDEVAREAEGVEGLYYPWRLLAVNSESRKAIPVQLVRDYENRTNVMLDKVMEAIFREGACPERITVTDERTEALLAGWCQEIGIALSMEEESDELEDFEEQLSGEETGDSLERTAFLDMLDVLEYLPEEILRSDPRQLQEAVKQFRIMMTLPDFPDELREKTQHVLDRLNRLAGEKDQAPKTKKGRKKKKTKTNQSYVISVSLETGCYRHLRISADALLEDLSDAILQAFAFDNDHMHGFFMDNREFSPRDAYYMRGTDADGPTTDEVTLAEAGLQVGQKFKYVFDFGDEWIFQCKVLKKLDEPTAEPQIVRTKGEAPNQYPDWDEYDDYFDEDDDDDDEEW